MPPESLHLQSDQCRQMLDHIRACLPDEACGFVAGRGQQVEQVLPVRNISPRRDRFQMDPAEQWAGMRTIEDAALELLGIYHSHPQGSPSLSPIDVKEAAYPQAAYLVWGQEGQDWRCVAFGLDQSSPYRIPIFVASDAPHLA